MAISPATGALSPTQLAVLEQIRALRAAKNATPVQATAPVQSAVRIQAKPVAAQPAPAQPLAVAINAPGPMPTNRPRGSLLNITA